MPEKLPRTYVYSCLKEFQFSFSLDFTLLDELGKLYDFLKIDLICYSFDWSLSREILL